MLACMTTVADPALGQNRWLGIAEVARLSGLSQDTLRWYEREGLIPPVGRGPDGRRRFSERDVGMVVMLAKLRATGMPTDDMRAFAQMIGERAASHGRRLALLESHRLRIADQMAALSDALNALNAKADHYRSLIAAGLDCDNVPVSPEVARKQQEIR
jgi:DNA-binding transcriptional MerR regulator